VSFLFTIIRTSGFVQAWIDPQSGVALILMVQRANFRNSDDSPVRLAFTQAAMRGK